MMWRNLTNHAYRSNIIAPVVVCSAVVPTVAHAHRQTIIRYNATVVMTRRFASSVPQETHANSPSHTVTHTSVDVPRVNIIKLISRSGVASRRDVVRMIKDGRVTVDGVVMGEKDSFHIPTTSRVNIDGRPFLSQGSTNKTTAPGTSPLPFTPVHVPSHLPLPKVWLYHKPAGLLVSHKDVRFGRPTVFARIEEDYFSTDALASTHSSPSHSPAESMMPRFLSVGRLDYLSEGLLLLTNTGSIQQFLEHPSSGLERTYRIRVKGELRPDQIEKLEAGLNIDGFIFKPVRITTLQQTRLGTWYELVVTEGKNRELRTLLNYFDLNIDKLVRTGFHQWRMDVPERGFQNIPSTWRPHPKIRFIPGAPDPQRPYTLEPGELIEVPWTMEMEQARANWSKEWEEKRKLSPNKTDEQSDTTAPASADSATPPSILPQASRSSTSTSASPTRPRTVTVLASSLRSKPKPKRPFEPPPPMKSRWIHSIADHRRMFSTVAGNSSEPPSSSPPSSTHPSFAEVSPPKKPKRQYPEDRGEIVILAEPKEKLPSGSKGKGKGSKKPGDPEKIRASLQRGAPKPRVQPPTPVCLKGIDKPWMQDELTLMLPTGKSTGGNPEFHLRISQWTGLSFPSESSVDPSTSGPNADSDGDGDAGSGTIIWDAGLHAAEYLSTLETPFPVGTSILEIGSGTGALGLAAERISGGFPTILTDSGSVLKLLTHNVQQNPASKAIVLPLPWNVAAVSPFFDELQARRLPPIRTILCSELLDSIPSSANSGRTFGIDSFANLVHMIHEVAIHACSASFSLPTIPLTVWFTFEQRGVLRMGSDEMLDQHLLRPLMEAGFAVEPIHTNVFRPGSDLVLLRMKFQKS